MKLPKFLQNPKPLNKLFSFFSPFVVFKVIGDSMLPIFKSGQKVLIKKKWFFCNLGLGDVVVMKDPRNRNLILKRIQKIKNDLYYVVGDNVQESTDSRVFGWVDKSAIIGKVVYVSPF